MTAQRRIDIKRLPGLVQIVSRGVVLADSSNALQLDEEGHGPVFYIPPEDVDLARLRQSERTSHCPYKGDATYFSFVDSGEVVADIAWCYEQPLSSVGQIKGHLAFYDSKCDVHYQPE